MAWKILSSISKSVKNVTLSSCNLKLNGWCINVQTMSACVVYVDIIPCMLKGIRLSYRPFLFILFSDVVGSYLLLLHLTEWKILQFFILIVLSIKLIDSKIDSAWLLRYQKTILNKIYWFFGLRLFCGRQGNLSHFDWVIGFEKDQTKALSRKYKVSTLREWQARLPSILISNPSNSIKLGL